MSTVPARNAANLYYPFDAIDMKIPTICTSAGGLHHLLQVVQQEAEIISINWSGSTALLPSQLPPFKNYVWVMRLDRPWRPRSGPCIPSSYSIWSNINMPSVRPCMLSTANDHTDVPVIHTRYMRAGHRYFLVSDYRGYWKSTETHSRTNNNAFWNGQERIKIETLSGCILQCEFHGEDMGR